MNVISRLEFELAYFVAAVLHFNHDATVTLSYYGIEVVVIY